MNSSSLRTLLIEWAAMACAVVVFVGAAMDTPDVPTSAASSTASRQAGR